MSTSVTLLFATLLDKALGKAFDFGLDSLKDAASAQLQSAAKDLNKEQTGREQRMAAIVQNAAETALPGLRELEGQPGWPYANILEHQAFLNDVVKQLLLGGQPDVTSLRGYVEETVGPEAWQQMGGPLLRFVDEIERQLRQDGLWAAPLAVFRTDALLAGLDPKLLRIAEATESAASTLKEMRDQLDKMVRQQGKDFDFAAAERPYLRGLYAECNNLLLASEAPVGEQEDNKPRLQRVYVDLRIDAEPTLAQIWDRLAVPISKRSKLEQALNHAFGAEMGMGRERGGLPDDPAKRLHDRPDPDIVRRLREQGGERQNEALTAALKQAGLGVGAFMAQLGQVTVFEAMRQHRQMVLLGDPGSGKSTLTQRMAGILASVAMDEQKLAPEEVDWQRLLAPAVDHWLLPIRIALSGWAAHLSPASNGVASDLIAECLRLLRKRIHLTGDSLEKHLHKRLDAQPPSLLLLLDGLDEVSDAGQRQRLLAAIQDFCRCYEDTPLLITCRQRPYQEAEAFRLPLPDFHLAELDAAAITSFLQRWHAELIRVELYDPDQSLAARQRLEQALTEPDRRDLREMAGTPLLLTMMARVNYRAGLPGSRAELYEEYIEELLWEWEKKKQKEQGQEQGQYTALEHLLQKAGRKRSDLEQALDRLAYAVHGRKGTRDTVDIPRADVRDALEAISPGDDSSRAAWAVQVLDLIDERSGLLHALELKKLYRFSHRTFQEYLAARWLVTDNFLTKFREKLDDPNWREVMLLGVGHMVYKQRAFGNVLTLLDELADEPAGEGEAYWRRQLLLGEAYVRLLTPQRARQANQARLAERVMAAMPERLTAAMQNPKLPPRQRLEAGLLLADLDIDPPGLDDFVPIPRANFSIGRYPVTNKQYKRFMDADGYDQSKPWWTKKGIEELVRFWDSWPTEPHLWDNTRFNRSTQPVVGVSWYEANAYCAWLTAKLQAEGQNMEARLPTQAEWEQAAGKAKYPWGSTFAAANANTAESGLNQTTPVHMYPAGKTEQKVWDMDGNVWEWTADRYSGGNAYWLIGGAWYQNKDHVGAAARSSRLPDGRDDNIGFRCVVVPRSS